ncbi:MAG: hypothetical protein FVQ85_00485 [Planctomycetes bacterium]|nr:hypothetical protein [Planctomycetota bacterium]
MKYYTLSGYIAPLNKVPAFVIPVFREGDEFLVQRTTAADRIEGFDVIADVSHDDLLSCTHSIKVREGDKKVYAFALSEDDIYEGTKTSLAKKIASLVTKLYEHPFTALQVFRFTNDRDQILVQILHIKAKLSETDPGMAEEWAGLQTERLEAAPGPNEVGTAGIDPAEVAVLPEDSETESQNKKHLKMIERVKKKKVPDMTVGRAVLLGLMNRYLKAVMDPFVSLLEMHKLMYFMQDAGENLRLNYTKALYGPYAKNLRHVLNVIEGHFISGFADAEDRPDTRIELMPDAAKRADRYLMNHCITRKRFDRVVDLIKGFETPFGMELLSTVHWVAMRERAKTAAQAIKRTYLWNVRKQMFKEEHITIAWKVLEQKEWLPKNGQ